MKIAIILLFFSTMAQAKPYFVQGGECSLQKPSLRAVGVSSFSKESAYHDANVLASRSCKEHCKHTSGVYSELCGIHKYDFKEETHEVTADYTCSCPF